jgi:acetyl esterase/lipase
VDNTSNRLGWEAYLGAADPNMAVPVRKEDLSCLPPAWIGVGSLDVLHDVAVAYAQRLQDAGVPCELEVVSCVFHGFDAVAPRTSVAQTFFASQLRTLRGLRSRLKLPQRMRLGPGCAPLEWPISVPLQCNGIRLGAARCSIATRIVS